MFVNVGHDIPEGFGCDIRINGEDVTSSGNMLENSVAYGPVFVLMSNSSLFSVLLSASTLFTPYSVYVAGLMLAN